MDIMEKFNELFNLILFVGIVVVFNIAYLHYRVDKALDEIRKDIKIINGIEKSETKAKHN